MGSSKIIKADVRIIGATNKDLMSCVKNGTFREDLYYRFNVIEIRIPPLRDRKDHIVPLARHLLKESVKTFELPPKDFSKDAEKALVGVRLAGKCQGARKYNQADFDPVRDSVIERRDLFSNDYNSCSVKEFLEEKLTGFLTEMKKLDKSNLYETVISEVEKALFSIVLNETRNQVGAAKILGINRNTLSKKMKEYKII